MVFFTADLLILSSPDSSQFAGRVIVLAEVRAGNNTHSFRVSGLPSRT